MTLEQQVCSFPLAQRLKELGVKQESYFIWWYTEAMSTDVKYFPEVDWEKREWSLKIAAEFRKSEEFAGRAVSAFTVAELGEMLPAEINTRFGWLTFVSERDAIDGQWTANYMTDDYSLPAQPYSYLATTEADARAKMLIYLLENKLITV